MNSVIVGFNLSADGTPEFSSCEVHQVVRFWVNSVREILKNDAFRFIRFAYPDITIEVRSNTVGYYRYRCVYKLEGGENERA